jgi:hypothetical protein
MTGRQRTEDKPRSQGDTAPKPAGTGARQRPADGQPGGQGPESTSEASLSPTGDSPKRHGDKFERVIRRAASPIEGKP